MDIEKLEAKAWDKFLEGTEQGNLFCSTKWLSLYNPPLVVYGCIKGDRLVGGISGLVDNGFTGVFPLTQSTGVVVEHLSKYATQCSLENEVALRLIEAMERDHKVIDIANHYTFTDIRPFLWKGYTPRVKYTYVVDIRDITTAWSRMEQDTRYEINRAEKRGAEARDGTMEEFIGLYYGMWERKELESPVSKEFLLNMARVIPNDILVTDTAGAVMVYDSKRAYYILGASTEKGDSSYIVWEAMKQARVKGYTEVDMVGANTQSIALFKRGFGGVLKPYYQVTKEVK